MIVDVWYRTDEGVRSFFDRHLDAARDGPFFHGDVIEELRDGELAGRDRLNVLAPIVTAECWLDRHLD